MTVKFFVPNYKDEIAENLWQAWAKLEGADPAGRRIFKVQSVIDGKLLTFQVGQVTPIQYGRTTVLAIFYDRKINRHVAYAWGRGVSRLNEPDEGKILIGGIVKDSEWFSI